MIVVLSADDIRVIGMGLSSLLHADSSLKKTGKFIRKSGFTTDTRFESEISYRGEVARQLQKRLKGRLHRIR